MDLYFKMDVLLENKNKDDVSKKTRYASAFAFIIIFSQAFVAFYLLN